MSDVIPHWLTKQADLLPDSVAVETPDGVKLTFAELKTNSERYARRLASCGIGEGDHVAVLSPNSIEMITAIHALSYLGVTVVLLNTRLAAAEVVYQLRDADVSFLLAHRDNKSLAGQAAAAVSGLEWKSFQELEAYPEAEVYLKTEVDLGALFTIIYTSGTTGFPKGVQHTYGNHWWSAVSSALNLGLSNEDKWLATLPLFHVGGLSIMLKSVIYGMPVYLLEKFKVKEVHEAIMYKGVTIVSAVAVMLQQLLDKLGEEQYPETFRCMLLGGGPAAPALLERAEKHRIPVFQTYGMTETASQIATLNPAYAAIKSGSAGKALFPAQLKVITETGDAAPLEPGEIVVKGPMVTDGYYSRQARGAELIKNGWLFTGDAGYLDQDGFLYVIDRRKDLIISGGENIYPAEVENILTGMTGVKEAGVTGIDDQKWGQVPVAFIVPANEQVTAEDVVNYCMQQLAGYKIPRQIFFVSELPRNAANKIMRHRLADLL